MVGVIASRLAAGTCSLEFVMAGEDLTRAADDDHGGDG